RMESSTPRMRKRIGNDEKQSEIERAAQKLMSADNSNGHSKSELPINQIVKADSIELLNSLPEGWVDLCFADPPFNIGYLYHGYDDKKDVDEYVDWSEKWMSAVYRA